WSVSAPAGCVVNKSVVGPGFSGTVGETGSRLVVPTSVGVNAWLLHILVPGRGMSDLASASMTLQLQPPVRRTVVARNADGRVQVFLTNENDGIAVGAQTGPGDGFASGWSIMPGSLRVAAAETNADGRMQQFALDAYGYIFTSTQVSAGSGNWS